MKSLIAIITLASSLSFAMDIEPGTYKAVDVDSHSITATLQVRPNYTAYMMLTAPDFVMPEPGCEGTYLVDGHILKADMKCPLEGMEQVKVSIDITDITPESVRSEPGVIVDVIIDSLGKDAYKFELKKIN